MERILEFFIGLDNKTGVRIMSVLIASITFSVIYGGYYRLDYNDTQSGERKFFGGRLFATLQAYHRKPGVYTPFQEKRPRRTSSNNGCLMMKLRYIISVRIYQESVSELAGISKRTQNRIY